jgi:predicted phosphatase
MSIVEKYDKDKYTPPFRIGRKQKKAVVDSNGLEVVLFTHSEQQAKLYCEYLNS